MKYQLVIRPEAESDLIEAYRWYEERRQGLGLEFLLSVEASFGSVQRSPELYPIVYKEVRRVLTQRFPFGVYYLSGRERIVILAVFHVRRDPEKWKKRSPQ